jgi:hypothetical protein
VTEQEKIFCAFCKSPRMISLRKRVGVLHVLMSLVFGGLLNAIFWSYYDPRGLVFALLFILLAEVCVQLRWRLSLKCKECGFDPVLYINDRAQAVAQVKYRLFERSKDPQYMLRPQLNLPRISSSRAEFLANETPSVRGSALNRQA